MKKIIIASLLIFASFFYVSQAQAVDVEINIEFNDPNIKARYAGSMLAVDNPFAEQYWYLEPESQERLLIKNGVTVSRLLKNYATVISQNDLNKIPTKENQENADYNLVQKYKGKFISLNNEFWYINPLDTNRYQIQNGDEGFATLKNLSLNISADHLSDIPESNNPNFSSQEAEVDFSIYERVMGLLENQYYDTEVVDKNAMFYGSMAGLVNSLGDPYTQFFSPQDKDDFDDKIEGEVEGIGAMVETVQGILTVISPLSNTPAEKAGLLPEDQIWFVDEVDVRGYETNDAIRLIKGPSNTPVVLGIYRPASDESFNLTIVRQKITVPYVSGEKLDDNIAYIKIHMFSINSAQMFADAVQNTIDSKTKGVILDLRNNPGGYTGAAVDIADFWLKPGDVIFQEKYPDQTYSFPDTRAQEISLPTVVLVNNGSASASEIVTSALKNHDAATIVGQETFGKGTGQMLRSFADGSALKFTVFEWLDSNGDHLEGQGIVPDYEVLNTDVQDKQLQRAKDLLR